ncbi:unnamed protein product [Closterium sp. Naga37s-1]|nr:unnamed protein product [Closterium sp. Naga37s-1]
MPLLFLLLLLLPLPHSTAASHGSGGAAAARLNGLAEDPLADDDSFARLAEADKRRWAQGAAEDAGLAAKMRRLAEVEVVTRVHVRLVGFDGDRDDNSNLRVQPVRQAGRRGACWGWRESARKKTKCRAPAPCSHPRVLAATPTPVCSLPLPPPCARCHSHPRALAATPTPVCSLPLPPPCARPLPPPCARCHSHPRVLAATPTPVCSLPLPPPCARCHSHPRVLAATPTPVCSLPLPPPCARCHSHPRVRAHPGQPCMSAVRSPTTRAVHAAIFLTCTLPLPASAAIPCHGGQLEEMSKFLNTLKPDTVFRAIHGEVWHSRRGMPFTCACIEPGHLCPFCLSPSTLSPHFHSYMRLLPFHHPPPSLPHHALRPLCPIMPCALSAPSCLAPSLPHHALRPLCPIMPCALSAPSCLAPSLPHHALRPLCPIMPCALSAPSCLAPSLPHHALRPLCPIMPCALSAPSCLAPSLPHHALRPLCPIMPCALSAPSCLAPSLPHHALRPLCPIMPCALSAPSCLAPSLPHHALRPLCPIMPCALSAPSCLAPSLPHHALRPLCPIMPCALSAPSCLAPSLPHHALRPLCPIMPCALSAPSCLAPSLPHHALRPLCPIMPCALSAPSCLAPSLPHHALRPLCPIMPCALSAPSCLAPSLPHHALRPLCPIMPCALSAPSCLAPSLPHHALRPLCPIMPCALSAPSCLAPSLPHHALRPLCPIMPCALSAPSCLAPSLPHHALRPLCPIMPCALSAPSCLAPSLPHHALRPLCPIMPCALSAPSCLAPSLPHHALRPLCPTMPCALSAPSCLAPSLPHHALRPLCPIMPCALSAPPCLAPSLPHHALHPLAVAVCTPYPSPPSLLPTLSATVFPTKLPHCSHPVPCPSPLFFHPPPSPPSSPPGSRQSHALAVRQRVAFSVSRAPRRLASAISADIFRFVGRVRAFPPFTPPLASPPVCAWQAMGRVAEGGVVLLPHALVDTHVRTDAATPSPPGAASAGEGSGAGGGYAVYVLNPRVMPRRYAYSYGSRADTVCPGTTFHDERYVWVDLTAGPVSYGPAWEGQGGVTPAAYLRAEQYSKELLHGAFLAHVAVLVDSAVRHVFVPPLLHAPVVYAVTTDIWLIAMHSGAATGGEEDTGLDLGAIKEQLLARSPPVLLAGQQVRFKRVDLSLATCSFCSTALHRAMRSGLYEASAGAASSSAAGVPGGMEVRRHLDSEDLHHHLSEFWPEITELAGLPLPDYAERNDPNPHAGRFFPVFLFDLHEPAPLLLDGRHRALAYDDMVLAVRTTAPLLPSHYMCEGEVVDVDPSNVTRPVLSAILHTAWGVAPTHEAWSAIHNASQHDYRWSGGMTPMGPFSRHLTVTTTMRDTALRNVVLSTLNSTISSMLHLLSALQRYGSEEAALKPGAVRQRFEQRWGVLRHKLQRAATALSAVDMHLAGYYARSARHDMDALFELAGQSAQDMHTSFSCFQVRPLPLPLTSLPLPLTMPWHSIHCSLANPTCRRCPSPCASRLTPPCVPLASPLPVCLSPHPSLCASRLTPPCVPLASPLPVCLSPHPSLLCVSPCCQEAPVAWSVWGGGAVLAYLAFLVGRNRWRVWRVKHKRF